MDSLLILRVLHCATSRVAGVRDVSEIAMHVVVVQESQIPQGIEYL